MCGIVGVVARHHVNVIELLLLGLQRLEYRGYDSAGVAVVDHCHQLQRLRCIGKVDRLTVALKKEPLTGHIGIAHTRWATHGKPMEHNAHPHVCAHIAVVHNGIIENHQYLRALLQQRGYTTTSETDSEVIAHLVHWEQQNHGCLRTAVQNTIQQLEGSYSMAILDSKDPQKLIVVCAGSPLVVGKGKEMHLVASDQLALLPITQQLFILQEQDIAELTPQKITIFNAKGCVVERPSVELQAEDLCNKKGPYRYYMQKEIYEQPQAIERALADRINTHNIYLEELAQLTQETLAQVRHVQILACGTSYHAGAVARYWFESLAHIPCDVEIASEFRYRHSVTRKNSLVIVLSQSGETADTLAALRCAKTLGYLASLAICNHAGSSLAREADIVLLTRAGREISVASTKAFTTQLVLLLLLVTALGRLQRMTLEQERTIIQALRILPQRIHHLLSLDRQIEALAPAFIHQKHTLFIGRGEYYPIAMEGALKLKEISYIHAEAYAAGELKHGPLALIDTQMPVVALLPDNALLKKTHATIEEVHARGGQLIIFTDYQQLTPLPQLPGITVVTLPPIEMVTAPIYYTVPLQLLSYAIALCKGNDIDKPRNLAKSVTVE